MRLTGINYCLVFGMLLILTACGKNDSTTEQARQVVAYERADECHLCGMVITRFEGPKAQLYEREVQKVRKFCSTRDMFSYLLQPENSHRITDVYVHDMAQVPWAKPDDSHMINARDAWYVINHKLGGAMGPTLASFTQESDALEFIKNNGGSITRFEDISLEMLMNLANNTLVDTALENDAGQSHIHDMKHEH